MTAQSDPAPSPSAVADPITGAMTGSALNFPLSFALALKSLSHHWLIALVTVVGIALGVAVVGAILIVDRNTAHSPPGYTGDLGGGAASPAAEAEAVFEMLRQPAFHVTFERRAQRTEGESSLAPTQKGQAQVPSVTEDGPAARRGEEDYQAMRLAVRLASLLALFVGALIVFYTMRYSVAGRAKEFCLRLCLGERRANVGLSVFMEAIVLGAAGTLVGIALSLLIAALLLGLGISTNGRAPLPGFAVPLGELAAICTISLVIVLFGVWSPVRAILRLSIADVLQPRQLGGDLGQRALTAPTLTWLIPPFLAASYLGVRPLLESWLSVVYFFLVEALSVAAIAIATLWWLGPLLSVMLRVFESVLRPWLPLEVFLTGRRLRISDRSILFSVVGVTLVFSLLTGLHDITRALKDEIYRWSSEALLPYSYFERDPGKVLDELALQDMLQRQDIHLFRLSGKEEGDFPVRLIARDDLNPYRLARGQPPLVPGQVILSRTLAVRFGLVAGDRVVIHTGEEKYRFTVLEVSDAVGFFVGSGQYVDLKSYALFSDGNPVFADGLEDSLGDYVMARTARSGARFLTPTQNAALSLHYRPVSQGRNKAWWQINEIDRDFLIFDFILLMTIILAGIGVANTMLIQVHARERQFSVLRSIGVGRWQIAKLLLIEGALIGMVAGAAAIVLGNALGAVSVTFLDHFTLFDYRFRFSLSATLWLFGFAVVTCVASALYPALVARNVSSAEALHYE